MNICEFRNLLLIHNFFLAEDITHKHHASYLRHKSIGYFGVLTIVKKLQVLHMDKATLCYYQGGISRDKRGCFY